MADAEVVPSLAVVVAASGEVMEADVVGSLSVVALKMAEVGAAAAVEGE